MRAWNIMVSAIGCQSCAGVNSLLKLIPAAVIGRQIRRGGPWKDVAFSDEPGHLKSQKPLIITKRKLVGFVKKFGKYITKIMAVECTKIITEADQTFCVGTQVNLNKSINGVRWVCRWINWTSEVLNIHPRTNGLSHASLINSARHECTRDVLSTDCPTLSNADSPLDLRGVNIEYVPKGFNICFGDVDITYVL